MINWKEIANLTQTPVITFDVKKTVVFANESARKMVPGLVGMNFLEALHLLGDSEHFIAGKRLYSFGGHPFYIETQADVNGETLVLLRRAEGLIDSYAKEAFSGDTLIFIAFADGPALFVSDALRVLLEMKDPSTQKFWGTMRQYFSLTCKGDLFIEFSKEQSPLELKVLQGPYAGKTVNFNVKHAQKGLIVALGQTDTILKAPKDTNFGAEILAACDEISPYGSAVFDLENVLFANFQAKEIFALSGQKTEKTPIRSIKFTNEESEKQFFKSISEAIADPQKVSSFQVGMRDQAGQTKTVRLITKYIEYLDSTPAMLAIVMDVTRHVELLKKSVERDSIRSLLQKLNGMMLKKPNYSSLLQESLAMVCEALGFADAFVAENADGKYRIVASCKKEPHDITEVLGFSIKSAQETGKPQHLLETVDGQTTVIYINPLLLVEHKNMVLVFCAQSFSSDMYAALEDYSYAVGVCLELTSLKTKGKESQEEIQKLSKFRADILETINHEMKTPLTSVLGYAEFITSGMFKEVPQIKEAASSIYVAGKQLERLISELSRLSKETLALPELNIISLPTREILMALANLMMPIFESAMVSFAIDVPKDIPEILADETKLKEIVLNLLSNAAKYTETGDEISLTAVVVSKGFIKITVQDTGMGIPNDKKKHIFKKYAKLSKDGEGRGLGLYLSKVYAEAMGGRLYFESEGKGKGSSFYLVLPADNLKFPVT